MIKQPPNILIIRSQRSELKRVEQFIKEIFSYYNFNEACFNKVLLCVSEATINSIIHGNKEDGTKKVELNVNCKTHIISINITDEGQGFDTTSIPDPTHSDHILKESGRGIHIIRNIARSVWYNEKGNSLRFDIECK